MCIEIGAGLQIDLFNINLIANSANLSVDMSRSWKRNALDVASFATVNWFNVSVENVDRA